MTLLSRLYIHWKIITFSMKKWVPALLQLKFLLESADVTPNAPTHPCKINYLFTSAWWQDHILMHIHTILRNVAVVQIRKPPQINSSLNFEQGCPGSRFYQCRSLTFGYHVTLNVRGQIIMVPECQCICIGKNGNLDIEWNISVPVLATADRSTFGYPCDPLGQRSNLNGRSICGYLRFWTTVTSRRIVWMCIKMWSCHRADVKL